MLPFHVVQNWPLFGKVLAGLAVFLVGFLAFGALIPGGGDGPYLVAGGDDAADDDASSEPSGESSTPSVDGAEATTDLTLPGGAPAPDAEATADPDQAGASSAAAPEAEGTDEQAVDDGASDADRPATGGSGSAFETLRNDQPKFSQFASVPSAQLDIGALTESAERPDNGSVGDGQFRAACEYSHFSYDDPIVFPGEPGRSHLHMFFGNTETDAFTTDDTLLNSGGGTCNGYELNRSAYWTPALLDGQGNVVVPDSIILYYKTKDTGSVQAMPQGLKMVAGNTRAETFTADQLLAWSCGGSGQGYNYTNRIPDCGGDVINATVVFPNCWDGVNLDSSDHLSHLVYVDENRSCPAEYPVRLPQISILMYFPGTNSIDGWHLASDRASGFNTGPGATLHADWWGGWNDDAINLWTNGCMRAARNCSFGQTGTDRQLASLNGLEVYDGPNLLPLPEGSYPPA